MRKLVELSANLLPLAHGIALHGIELDLATGYGWRGRDGPTEGPDYIQTGPASMLRTTGPARARWPELYLQ